MTTTLITGANKGLGYETARRLVAAGHTVYIGARNPDLGRAAAERLGARFVELDVTDESSVTAAAKQIQAAGGLDVLINNAGVEGRTPDGGFVLPEDTTAETVQSLFDTNVFGVVRVIHAFLPLLEHSEAPVVVNVSSGLSLTRELVNPASPSHFYPAISYPASKAAVNMITVQYAKAYPGIRINAVEPGYTKTDLNYNTGTQTVEEGAEIIVRMAQVSPYGPSGGFFDVNGSIAW
jgi:NAD(P)-dependent dehydrogenase (short-subunit alcohol dehydrogenase family)